MNKHLKTILILGVIIDALIIMSACTSGDSPYREVNGMVGTGEVLSLQLASDCVRQSSKIKTHEIRNSDGLLTDKEIRDYVLFRAKFDNGCVNVSIPVEVIKKVCFENPADLYQTSAHNSYFCKVTRK